MKIVVLAGGLSPERDVSLTSGCLIANALINNGHRVLMADVYAGLPGVGGFDEAYERYKQGSYEARVPEREPDLEAVRLARGGGPELIGENIIRVCAGADVTFIALHGDIGENGKLQALFDIYGVCYTGTGYAGSLIAMDKPLAKELMRAHGITTPDWTVSDCGDAAAAAKAAAEVKARFGFPCVIKPCACGSSVGVSIVRDAAEFDAAVGYASKYEKRLMAEQKIEGREFSVGVLGKDALPPIEIIPRQGFYDYKNKYQPGATVEVCPPRDLPGDVCRAMQKTALDVSRVLRLGDYSRLDIILGADGGMYCLEVNTLPGMTPTSLLPQEAAAAGIGYTELCERIIALALADR